MRSLLFLAFFSVFTNLNSDPALKKVLISQFVEHPALNDTTKGVIDTLALEGFKDGECIKIRVESAQASAALATQIANKFISQNPDIVVGVGTISAQSLAKYAIEGKVKLIFTTVTDPLKAELVKDLKKPSFNITGVSNFVPLEPQLELFKKLQPKLRRLGILYNPGELNSVSLVEKLEKVCPQMGLTLVKQCINKTADVAQSAVKLAQGVDAIFISNDNTALSSLRGVIKAAEDAKIPVYVSDTDAVEIGAVAALGPNQYEVGVQTGRMIARVLRGADVNMQEVEFPLKTELYINLEAATNIGLTVPEEIQKQAVKVFEKSIL